MARAQFADNWTSTLSAPYTSGGTSLTATNAALVPTGGDYYVLVQAEGANTLEVFKVTARSGNVLTVVGAQANTVASNHASGATIQGTILTSGAITQLRSDIVASLTVAAFDIATTNGTVKGGYDVVYLSDGLYTCIWNGAAWEYYHQGQRAYRPVDSLFAWLNQSTSSVNTSSGGIYLNQPAAATQYLAIRKKAAPSAPYTITAKIIQNIYPLAFCGVGICVGNGTAQHTLSTLYNANTCIFVDKWTSPTAYSASYVSITDYPFAPMMWLRINDNGTNRISSISLDGFNYRVVHTVGRADFVTPTEVGFFAKAQNVTQEAGVMLVSWQES